MLEFEKYLADFNSTIDLKDFLINFLVVVLLSFLVRWFYIRFGTAISDRRKFSSNFIPLALATMLIITVIKSSIALSLGLVGALSIVRFRTAIKDPEELSYLFLIIGLGLVGGANKPVLAILSFALILPILYINGRIAKKKKGFQGKTIINIKTSMKDVEKISNVLAELSDFLELNRADIAGEKAFYSFVTRVKDMKQLNGLQHAILDLDALAEINIIDQPALIL